MSEFKPCGCENGYFYPSNLDQCPYCEDGKGGGNMQDLPPSIPNMGNQGLDDDLPGGFGGLAKTKLDLGDDGPNFPSAPGGGGFGGGGGFDSPQTEIFGVGGGGGSDLSRTQIFSGGGMGGFDPSPNFPSMPQQQGRKMVGWLVSFTIDENGIDFKLYEGRNIIGADQGCDITVSGDQAVSGKHLTILHRMGHFKFRDEFSTNGTFINDVFVEEGTLKDGDVIRIGETIFKFRSIA